MKTLIKIPIIIAYFLSHLVLVLFVLITFIPLRISFLLKPNINKRKYNFSYKLLNKGALYIDRVFNKLI